ncbi:uncharacterized protein LOC134449427 [Engraulis encrasicolus]|uniref:uncharacterized protein LOC134449427 n=1 Tax=Engraulis encrasicolus TaxID=184585 RepID=UPI002FD2EC5B
MQSEAEARAVETAVRAAVLSVVDVINNIYTSRLVDYQRKVAEKDKENALLKAEAVRTEKELARLRRLAGSQRSEDVRSPSTDVQENLFLLATHCGKHAQPTGPFQSNVKQSKSANTEFQYERLSLGRTASSPRDDVVTGSPPPVCSPSWDSEGQVDFVDSIEFPLVKEERANTDTVYIKCEVKEENTSDFLEDMSTDQYHSDPHSSWTLERETPENYSFTHHHPSEVQTHTRSPSSALWGHGRLGYSVPRRKKKKHDVMDGNRESSRRYRERIRADPAKYQAYLQQERRRYQQRKKLIHELPEEMQRQKRELWREATRKSRAMKKSHTEQWTQPL